MIPSFVSGKRRRTRGRSIQPSFGFSHVARPRVTLKTLPAGEARGPSEYGPEVPHRRQGLFIRHKNHLASKKYRGLNPERQYTTKASEEPPPRGGSIVPRGSTQRPPRSPPSGHPGLKQGFRPFHHGAQHLDPGEELIVGLHDGPGAMVLVRQSISSTAASYWEPLFLGFSIFFGDLPGLVRRPRRSSKRWATLSGLYQNFSTGPRSGTSVAPFTYLP